MKSPFPGMDPYLDQHWHDVHHALITCTRNQIRPALPRELRSRIEERVFIESDEGEHYPICPDVHVVEYPRKQSGGSQPADGGAVAAAEPILVHVDREPASQGYIEIVDAGSGNRVVTVIEFLIPTNKLPGEGQTLCLKRQKDVIAAGASLVEIDLTRAGKHRWLGRWKCFRQRNARPTWHASRAGWKPGVAELYPLRLTEPLPALRIPLRQTDADVTLNLQSLIDQCYENGGYDTIDYRKPPVPPLDSEGAAWAEERLRAKGMLTS